METSQALTRFLKKCEERGLSSSTRRTYHSSLRQFAEEYPDLPTDIKTIEEFLKKRKETPAKRGHWFKNIQAFYAYLELFEGITSPVPASGKVGRPRKGNPLTSFPSLPKNQLVNGGPSTSISTAEAVESLIRARKVEGVSQRTLGDYRSFFKPFILKYPVLPLTVEPIEEFLGSIQGEPETRWTYRRSLVTLYHFLEDRKRIPKDLFTFPKIKVSRKVRRVLTQEELRGLFPVTENFQERAILTLLVDSKIRASELISLTRENTSPDHIVVDAKGGGTRKVPIKSETHDLLTQLAATGPLFRVNGRPMLRRQLHRILRRLMEDSGLDGKKLGPHILRHSASVQHMRHGGDLKSLQGELGHATTRMTDVYAELAYTDIQEAHDRVDVLGKVSDNGEANMEPAVSGEANMETAVCEGCKQGAVIAWVDVEKKKCPNCGQVGRWSLPESVGKS